MAKEKTKKQKTKRKQAKQSKEEVRVDVCIDPASAPAVPASLCWAWRLGRYGTEQALCAWAAGPCMHTRTLSGRPSCCMLTSEPDLNHYI